MEQFQLLLWRALNFTLTRYTLFESTWINLFNIPISPKQQLDISQWRRRKKQKKHTILRQWIWLIVTVTNSTFISTGFLNNQRSTFTEEHPDWNRPKLEWSLQVPGQKGSAAGIYRAPATSVKDYKKDGTHPPPPSVHPAAIWQEIQNSYFLPHHQFFFTLFVKRAVSEMHRCHFHFHSGDPRSSEVSESLEPTLPAFVLNALNTCLEPASVFYRSEIPTS